MESKSAAELRNWFFSFYNFTFSDFSLTDEEISPGDILVSFVALSQRSLLHLEVDLEMSHVVSGGKGDSSEAQINSVPNADSNVV